MLPAVRVERDNASQPPSGRSVVRHRSSVSMVLAEDDGDAPDAHIASLRSYEGALVVTAATIITAVPRGVSLIFSSAEI